MSIHNGHRQRLKERFKKEGLDHFEQLQVLELMLFYCIPRKDTNEIAHRLLDRFGSVAKVVEAPVEELRKVPGVGENAAVFLSLLNDFGRYHKVNRVKNMGGLKSVEECGTYLAPYFKGRRNEIVFLLCLDAKCDVLCCREVGEGSVNSAAIPIRRIVEMALGANATSVVLAHNHPSGLAIPSGDDVQTTKRVAMALRAVDIELADHIVVADEDFVSLVDSKLYSPHTEYALI